MKKAQTTEKSTKATHIRSQKDGKSRRASKETLSGDGREDEGQVVPAVRYTDRVQARYGDDGTVAYAKGRVWVVGHRGYLPILFKAGE